MYHACVCLYMWGGSNIKEKLFFFFLLVIEAVSCMCLCSIQGHVLGKDGQKVLGTGMC